MISKEGLQNGRPRPADWLGLRQHLLGEQVEITGHACPECPVNSPVPFCPVCLGAGVITTERLGRYQGELWRGVAV